jgi:hypothetical protein
VSLSVEANDPSLENRHIKFGMQYATKLKAYLSNFAYDCLFNPLYDNVYHKQPNKIKSPIGNVDINSIQKTLLILNLER